MIRRFLYFVGGVAFGALLSAATSITVRREPDGVPVNLEPGSWFEDYVADWSGAHGVEDPEDVTSGFAVGAVSGDWVWVTNTPEWDRDWLEARGSRFPDKWVPFEFLDSALPSGSAEVVLLPGL